MTVRRLLFVCGKNLLRSPTAEQIFADIAGYDVMSAGTRQEADEVVSAELLDWADEVFVMEKRHAAQLR